MTDNARFWIAVLIAPLFVGVAVVLVNLVFLVGFGASFPALLQLLLVAMPVLYIATVVGWLPIALLIHRSTKHKGLATVVAAGLFWPAIGVLSIVSSDVGFEEGHAAFLLLCFVAGIFAGFAHSLVVYRKPKAAGI